MESKEQRAMNSAEERFGEGGKMDRYQDDLAQIVEDAPEAERYTAWKRLLATSPDPVWLKRRFGDHPDATIVADVMDRIEQLEEIEKDIKG